jgi:hypothetical protein
MADVRTRHTRDRDRPARFRRLPWRRSMDPALVFRRHYIRAWKSSRGRAPFRPPTRGEFGRRVLRRGLPRSWRNSHRSSARRRRPPFRRRNAERLSSPRSASPRSSVRRCARDRRCAARRRPLSKLVQRASSGGGQRCSCRPSRTANDRSPPRRLRRARARRWRRSDRRRGRQRPRRPPAEQWSP